MAFPRKITELTTQIGKAGVNALYPNDFEYYALSLELTDSSGNTLEYLTFPVSPESISYDNTPLTSIKKSMAGVSSLGNETFEPRKVQLTGTFGRKFKILLNNELGSYDPVVPKENTLNGHFKAAKGNMMSVKETVFDPRLKTGYGTTKILEAIIEKSKTYDDTNRSHRLFLYNPAAGHNWLVTVAGFHIEQDRTSNNMMWKYNLQFDVIAPMYRVRPNVDHKRSLQENTGIAALQSGLNTLTSKIRSAF